MHDRGEGSGAVAVFPFSQVSLCQHPLALPVVSLRAGNPFDSSLAVRTLVIQCFICSPNSVFFLDIFVTVRFEIVVFVFMYGESKLSVRGGSVGGRREDGRKREEDIFGLPV